MALSAMLLVGGCHLIAGYDPASPAGDMGTPSADATIPEGGTSIDGGSPPEDIHFTDGLSPEQRANCTGTTSGGDDGDLLFGDRDPEPTRCNVQAADIRFDGSSGVRWEAFTVRGTEWSPSGCFELGESVFEQTCLTNDDTEVYAGATGLSLLPGKSYLVEATVLLGPITNADTWDVSVLSHFVWPEKNQTDPYRYMLCGLHHADYLQVNGIHVSDLRLELRRDSRGYNTADPANSGVTGAWWLDPPPSYSTNDGDRYRLQLFYTPTAFAEDGKERVHCGLLDSADKRVRHSTFEIWNTSSFDYHVFLPAGPGSIGLRTINRAARFEQVQVFELYGG